MVSGIGIDIAEIARFERMVERFGDKVAHRVLTTQEFQQYKKRNSSMSFLALRFAAKEAASKAFGTGIAKGIGFHSIEVVNSDEGKPELVFHGAAAELIKQRSISSAFLSLSDEKHYAVAMVVLETA
ncbi:MAG: holo-ACP synthase [Gammaproteobacteria bacterium]|jgi:holo-[acyl-carrier protein] synthase|nr:holo-ACP synthase [Gammaproteobacteria bacterium]MBT3722005.1 holo-ACP synthase [Gammaproteobacteria bacterium]MBT4075723.1 holo-ACP synthase [Gammaproteobacteria bacterium]MBT4196810.1 holo-ACP synthase [Gammaproteobacteria bacterium]MBT4449129.1 holo-ACP synthase [Gammaproteobacteria bacterium]